MDIALKEVGIKLAAANIEQTSKAISWRFESSPGVVAKKYKPRKVKANPLRGLLELTLNGKPAIVEYTGDSDLRDIEQVMVLKYGGIVAFLHHEVLPHSPNAWIKEDATKIGDAGSFIRHSYKSPPFRMLEEISADILAIGNETEGLLDGFLKAPVMS